MNTTSSNKKFRLTTSLQPAEIFLVCAVNIVTLYMAFMQDWSILELGFAYLLQTLFLALYAFTHDVVMGDIKHIYFGFPNLIIVCSLAYFLGVGMIEFYGRVEHFSNPQSYLLSFKQIFLSIGWWSIFILTFSQFISIQQLRVPVSRKQSFVRKIYTRIVSLYFVTLISIIVWSLLSAFLPFGYTKFFLIISFVALMVFIDIFDATLDVDL